ncbi:DUF2069 domain-containing protein [Agitococcus lubricus]|uniref:Putative membrane protein DUF2069 n=1 Tax=Agitococcus lubricus TaxID=1077255 RepID=A0A2T5IZ28_9GAMM|nr:DUF2069 domain-containing protein [Agitococcus lubricus]PTQ89288.1 putative membrane protein DUF2069 [Agitococcus lubricus]
MLSFLRTSYVLFLALLCIGTFVTAPTASTLPNILVILSIQIIPLLAFFKAVWQKQSYGLLTLTLLLLVYMGFSTMNCFAGGLKQLFAIVELVVATWLILACSKAVKSLPRGHGAT